MKVNPGYSQRDVNLTKSFLTPAVQTHQISNESFQSIILSLSALLEEDNSPPSEKWLTIKETCLRLGITKPTVYRLIKSGQLRKIKVGRSTRLLESDVLRAYGGV